MNKRHYEHTLPNIRGSLSNTYKGKEQTFLNRWRRYAINLEESDIDR